MKHDVLLPDPRSPLHVRIASTRREYAAAFELLYRVYLAKGYTRPHPSELIYSQLLGLPTSRTIVAIDTGRRLAGSLSIVGDNRLGLPLESTYPDEVDALRRQGRVLAEISGLSVEPCASRRPREIFFALTEFMIQYAYWRQLDDLVMLVHPRHYRFYWQCFRAAPFGPCRDHKPVCGNPAIACRIDLRFLERNVDPTLWHRYFGWPYPGWCFSTPSMNAADHEYFCRRRGLAAGAVCADCGEHAARAG